GDDIEPPAALGHEARELLPPACANGGVRREMIADEQEAPVELLRCVRMVNEGVYPHGHTPTRAISRPERRSASRVAIASAILAVMRLQSCSIARCCRAARCSTLPASGLRACSIARSHSAGPLASPTTSPTVSSTGSRVPTAGRPLAKYSCSFSG